MALRQAVILCASFLGAFAASVGSGTCGESTEGQNTKDGYTLLEKGVKFALVNFSSEIPIASEVSCVTTKTTEKNDNNHTVMENITFKTDETSWRSLQQKFKFEQQGQDYNIMRPVQEAETLQQQGQSVQVSKRSDTEAAGQPGGQGEEDSFIVPPGNYTFVYFGTGCAVVKVDVDEESLTAEVAAREDTVAEDKPQCMFWMKQNTDNEDNCCEKYFKESCSLGSPTYVGSGSTCIDGNTPSPSQK
uniref:Lipocalin n=1 Tax=Rhipicephalus zambeziensis TaxID=60191 RepID=A0A224YCD5_9ACAR